MLLGVWQRKMHLRTDRTILYSWIGWWKFFNIQCHLVETVMSLVWLSPSQIQLSTSKLRVNLFCLLGCITLKRGIAGFYPQIPFQNFWQRYWRWKLSSIFDPWFSAVLDNDINCSTTMFLYEFFSSFQVFLLHPLRAPLRSGFLQAVVSAPKPDPNTSTTEAVVEISTTDQSTCPLISRIEWRMKIMSQGQRLLT